MIDPLSARTRRHEAAHVVALLMLCPERKIDLARVDRPTDNIGGEVNSSWREGGRLGAGDLIASLVGYLADDDCHREWPPSWPVDEDELDAVGKIIRFLGLTQERYEALVEVAEDLVADPSFQAMVDVFARGFAIAPILDAESVEILREAALIPEPEEAAA